MCLTTLPIELVDQITKCLEPEDQISFALTSKRHTEVVQRVLYRHLVLDPLYDNFDCIYTLANNPTVAKYVRNFNIRVKQPSGSLLSALNTALSNMTQLTSLDIYIEPRTEGWIMKTPDSSRYDCLTKFTCSFGLDHNLAHFLNKAPQIHALEIHPPPLPASDFASSLKPDSLPLLSHFEGSSEAAQILVPGRPVHDIHIHSGDLTEDVVQNLARGTVPVRNLSGVTYSHSIALIVTLTRCLQSLENLRIISSSFSDPPDLSYLADIAEALGQLPDLQNCEIWGFHWVSVKKGLYDTVRMWFSERFNSHQIWDGTSFHDVSAGYFFSTLQQLQQQQ